MNANLQIRLKLNSSSFPFAFIGVHSRPFFRSVGNAPAGAMRTQLSKTPAQGHALNAKPRMGSAWHCTIHLFRSTRSQFRPLSAALAVSSGRPRGPAGNSLRLLQYYARAGRPIGNAVAVASMSGGAAVGNSHGREPVELVRDSPSQAPAGRHRSPSFERRCQRVHNVG